MQYPYFDLIIPIAFFLIACAIVITFTVAAFYILIMGAMTVVEMERDLRRFYERRRLRKEQPVIPYRKGGK